MANSRDDFPQRVKELLGNRVGWRCSNPDCRKPTRGANDDPQRITNIGVASHICAAADGGPRYDPEMSPEERKSAENGIWLCQSCSKLVDDDVIRYNVGLLQVWKENAERLAIAELQSASPVSTDNTDIDRLRFFVQCFDRPAFQDQIDQEGRMEDFDQAIEDTIIAMNTGVLRTRDGMIIKKSEGKSTIINPVWREKLNTITDMLVALRKRLKIAKDEKLYSTYGKDDVMYCFHDRELKNWFDLTREEIIKILSSICQEAGIPSLHFPKQRYRW
ncbi:hypothetical protein [Desulfitobacterium hafniense]|uniref:hypothetical protein n=1 Tax=Desulfitobacterium hafniense TaxID=49338 RepID=UPI00037AF972|nr:hypothetical protein [Desulfitobacterium hafniense]